MKQPHPSKKTKKKRWTVRKELLEEVPCPPPPPPREIVSSAPPPPGMATLRAKAAEELRLLQLLHPPAVAGDVASPRGRAKNFPVAADRGTLRLFKSVGFEDWLLRVKQVQSVEATMTQVGEFAAWWKLKKRAPATTALDLFVNVAKVEKHAVETYNTYLHSLGFRAASILNRIDAVWYALMFMR